MLVYSKEKLNNILPGYSVVKNLPANAGDMGSIPGLKIPWRRKWQYTPVLLPGKSHGLSLEGDRLWGRKESRLSDFSFHFYTVDENVNCATAMENSLEFPQKTRIAKWSSNLPAGYTPRQNYNLKRYVHTYVHSSIIYNSQDKETIKMPMNRWIGKEAVVFYIYTHMHAHTNTQTMNYYSAIKKNEIMSFEATWMYLEIIIINEVY